MINSITTLFAGFFGLGFLFVLISPFIMAGELTKEVANNIKERQNLLIRLQK
jgi:hypothetical protein